MGTTSGGTSEILDPDGKLLFNSSRRFLSNRFLSSSNQLVHSGFSITRTLVNISSCVGQSKTYKRRLINCPHLTCFPSVSLFFVLGSVTEKDINLYKYCTCDSPPACDFGHVIRKAVVWTPRNADGRNRVYSVRIFGPFDTFRQGEDGQVVVNERESVVRMACDVFNLRRQ